MTSKLYATTYSSHWHNTHEKGVCLCIILLPGATEGFVELGDALAQNVNHCLTHLDLSSNTIKGKQKGVCEYNRVYIFTNIERCSISMVQYVVVGS